MDELKKLTPIIDDYRSAITLLPLAKLDVILQCVQQNFKMFITAIHQGIQISHQNDVNIIIQSYIYITITLLILVS